MNNKKFEFEITKKSKECTLARAGIIKTPHGEIKTPAFIPVGTKATVKSLSPEDVLSVGGQAVLANTYHLYLQPGQDIVREAGGFGKFMNWAIPHLASPKIGEEQNRILPTFTDSGGFQILSLGAAFNSGVTKIATDKKIAEEKHKQEDKEIKSTKEQMAKVDEEGVTFKSFIDGTTHRFTPEISMQIQHDLGADIFFAFDECTSPLATREYQIKAMDRTHRWATRCIVEHKRLGVSKATGEMQALFGVVQGGAYEDLRKISAETLGKMDFDGFGIGGSFTKDDMDKTVKSATEVLPEAKPRHLLGIGEPIDFFIGVEYGIDTFDCVSPTRLARHGNIYTEEGKINLKNSKYKNDFRMISEDKSHPSYGYTYAYLSHLFRADEMYAATIASKHNLHFLIKLVEKIRQSILDDNFFEFKKEFCDRFYKKEN